MENQLSLFPEADPNALPDPIPAKCPKCGYNWIGRDAIVAPTLSNCCCFWCSSPLRAHRGEKDFLIPDKHRDTTQSSALERMQRLIRAL